jgi:mono/diheme cytochrome c family protein
MKALQWTMILFAGWTGHVLAGAELGQNARLSGVVRHAATGQPLARAEVKLEGAALAARENSQAIKKTDTQGRFQLDVPPGSYTLWVIGRDLVETKEQIVLVAGTTIDREFRLAPLAASYAYRVETLALPPQMVPEVSGVAFTPGGTLFVTNRRGEVWRRGAADNRWRRFAHGLYEGFGLVADDETQVRVIQRPEVTRLRDLDGDGIADLYETLGDDWGITGNYHEFSYGLAADRAGNIYGGLGMVSTGEFPWVRGPLKEAMTVPWRGKGPVPDGHRAVAQYQGWVFQLTSRGEFIPWASGFRQPLGIGLSPDEELFVTDVSGAWVPTSALIHAERGGFYGHPDGLKWHPGFQHTTVTLEMLRQMRRPPAVYLPRGLMGTSPGQPVWDLTAGKFGPFAGQVFLGDVSALLMRVDLEKVAGAYQGAVFTFLRGQGLRIGGMHNAFGPDGALYVAQTVRGWIGTEGNEGIQRIAWTGEIPVDMHTLRLSDRGFVLRYTTPMEAAAAEARHYRVKRFFYNYHQLDGSLRVDETEVPVEQVRASDDGRQVELDLAELQPGFVYEIEVSSFVRSRSGRALLNPIADYTANRLRSGQTQPGPTRLRPIVAQITAPDPVRGEQIFKLNCMVCHQADGKGSKQVGTPDYTQPGGPLSRPDEELLATIAGGKNQMPPFGNVLPSQDIRHVLSYLRKTFGPGAAGANPP